LLIENYITRKKSCKWNQAERLVKNQPSQTIQEWSGLSQCTQILFPNNISAYNSVLLSFYLHKKTLFFLKYINIVFHINEVFSHKFSIILVATKESNLANFLMVALPRYMHIHIIRTDGN